MKYSAADSDEVFSPLVTTELDMGPMMQFQQMLQKLEKNFKII